MESFAALFCLDCSWMLASPAPMTTPSSLCSWWVGSHAQRSNRSRRLCHHRHQNTQVSTISVRFGVCVCVCKHLQPWTFSINLYYRERTYLEGWATILNLVASGWGGHPGYFRSKVQLTKARPMKTLVLVARATRTGLHWLKMYGGAGAPCIWMPWTICLQGRRWTIQAFEHVVFIALRCC